jgi:CheY-like chemotaxis protein
MKTDIRKFARMVHILIDRAVRDTDKGGVRVKVEQSPYSNEVTLIVADSGKGLQEKEKALLSGDKLQPEALASDLVLARRLTTDLGGKLRINTEEGRGTTILLTVPLSNAEEDKQETPDMNVANLIKISQSKKDMSLPKVLIVDDDQAIQYLLLQILDEKHNCFVASSAASAYTVLSNEKIRLIFMDINLGDSIDGIELTRQLRQVQEWEEIPIIMMSSHSDEETRGEAFCSGSDEFLAKPLQRNEVVSKAEELLTRQPIGDRKPSNWSQFSSF